MNLFKTFGLKKARPAIRPGQYAPGMGAGRDDALTDKPGQAGGLSGTPPDKFRQRIDRYEADKGLPQANPKMQRSQLRDKQEWASQVASKDPAEQAKARPGQGGLEGYKQTLDRQDPAGGRARQWAKTGTGPDPQITPTTQAAKAGTTLPKADSKQYNLADVYSKVTPQGSKPATAATTQAGKPAPKPLVGEGPLRVGQTRAPATSSAAATNIKTPKIKTPKIKAPSNVGALGSAGMGGTSSSSMGGGMGGSMGGSMGGGMNFMKEEYEQRASGLWASPSPKETVPNPPETDEAKAYTKKLQTQLEQTEAQIPAAEQAMEDRKAKYLKDKAGTDSFARFVSEAGLGAAAQQRAEGTAASQPQGSLTQGTGTAPGKAGAFARQRGAQAPRLQGRIPSMSTKVRANKPPPPQMPVGQKMLKTSSLDKFLKAADEWDIPYPHGMNQEQYNTLRNHFDTHFAGNDAYIASQQPDTFLTPGYTAAQDTEAAWKGWIDDFGPAYAQGKYGRNLKEFGSFQSPYVLHPDLDQSHRKPFEERFKNIEPINDMEKDMDDDGYNTKGERREVKRRKGKQMKVTGKGVQNLQQIISDRAKKLEDKE